LEIIAVNDASPDMCPQILDQWAAKDGRITVIHRKVNGRAGLARNDALELAKGKYIFFADSDDEIQPDIFPRLVDIAEVENDDIVFFSYAVVNENGFDIEIQKQQNRVFDLNDSKQFWECVKILNFALWNKLFRRKVIKGLRFEQFEANIGEDTLFNIAALCRSQRVVTSSYVGYRYTVHCNSATGMAAKGLPYLETLAWSQKRIKETFLERGDDIWLRKCADWLAIKRFATGCEWIAENTDQMQRESLRRYWYNYLSETLLPNLDNYQVIGRAFQIFVTLFNPGFASRLCRFTVLAMNR
jgi:glycosyltransferase involved in cell wall biosynthesis